MPIAQPTSDTVISGLETASSLVNQYVVSPIAALGIAGFAFSTRGEIKSEMPAQSSDNYNEKNIALQDNIALAPEIFTLSGFIGEVVYKTQKPKKEGLTSLAQKLTTVAGYLPTITATAKQLQNSITSAQNGTQNYLESALGSGIDLYQTFQKLNPPKTQQAKAYNFFRALRQSRSLVSFDTPYGFKANYMILNAIYTQPEFTEGKTDVVITLKEMRFATTATVPFDPNKYQGRAAQQNSPIANNGNAQGTSDSGFVGKLISSFK